MFISTKKLNDDIREGDKNSEVSIIQLRGDISNIQSESKNTRGQIEGVQTEIKNLKQNLEVQKTNLDGLDNKMDTIRKNFENQLSIDQEIVSAKILELSVLHNNIKEKVKDIENILNPCPRKIFSNEVKIEELTRYFGLKFNKSGRQDFIAFFNRQDELEIFVQESPSILHSRSEENKRMIDPFITSLLSDFKNISNKIPYYQKRVNIYAVHFNILKVIQLNRIVGEIEKERPKRNMGELGKIGIHEYSQEPFMKSPSKLAHSSSEIDDCILTADDVNSNLFTVRAEMMSETESKFFFLSL